MPQPQNQTRSTDIGASCLWLRHAIAACRSKCRQTAKSIEEGHSNGPLSLFCQTGARQRAREFIFLLKTLSVYAMRAAHPRSAPGIAGKAIRIPRRCGILSWGGDTEWIWIMYGSSARLPLSLLVAQPDFHFVPSRERPERRISKVEGASGRRSARTHTKIRKGEWRGLIRIGELQAQAQTGKRPRHTPQHAKAA